MGKLIHVRSLKSPTDVDFLFSTGSTGSTTDYTFSSLNFGVADFDRKIVVGVSNTTLSQTSDVHTVTIGGIAASKIVGGKLGFSGYSLNTSLWMASVPTGTSGDVRVQHGGSNARQMAVVGYRLISIGSTFDTDDFGTDVDGTHVSMDLDIPAAGAVAIGLASMSDFALSWTWTGLQEDSDFTMDEVRFTSASQQLSAAETARTIRATASATYDRAAGCCAVFRAA